MDRLLEALAGLFGLVFFWGVMLFTPGYFSYKYFKLDAKFFPESYWGRRVTSAIEAKKRCQMWLALQYGELSEYEQLVSKDSRISSLYTDDGDTLGEALAYGPGNMALAGKCVLEEDAKIKAACEQLTMINKPNRLCNQNIAAL